MESDDPFGSIKPEQRVPYKSGARKPQKGDRPYHWRFFWAIAVGWFAALIAVAAAAAITNGASSAGFVLFSSFCATSIGLVPLSVIVLFTIWQRFGQGYKNLSPGLPFVLWTLLICMLPVNLFFTGGVVIAQLKHSRWILWVAAAAAVVGMIAGWFLGTLAARRKVAAEPAVLDEAPPDEDEGSLAFETEIDVARTLGLERPDRDLDPNAYWKAITVEDLARDSTFAFQARGFFDRHVGDLMLGAIFTVLGLGITALCAGMTIRRQMPLWPGLGAVTFGMLVFLFGAYFVFSFWRTYYLAPNEVTVGPDGLWVHNARGTVEYHWSDVARVWRSESVLIQNNVKVWTSSTRVEFFHGKPLELDHSLAGYRRLAALIQAHVAQLMTPQLASLWQKQPLTFGPLTLRKDFVIIKPDFSLFSKPIVIDFDDIAAWGVYNGDLIFHANSRKREVSIPMGNLPNYQSLLALLEMAAPNRPLAILPKRGLFG